MAQVAEEIGVSVTTITRIKNGGRMEVDVMLAMVAGLGVAVEPLCAKRRPLSA